MTTFRTPFTNFTAGEFTPLLAGRYDIKKYFNSVLSLENFFPKPFGGLTKTPGTRMVYELKDQTRTARVIDFKFNKVQSYALCFEGGRMSGDTEIGGYIRFFAEDGIIVQTGTTTPYEIESPYKEEDLSEINYTQKKDVLYLCHPDYETRKIIRYDHNDWRMSVVEFRHGPFGFRNTEKDSFIDFDNRVGDVTLNARKSIFTSDHVGEKFKLQDGTILIDSVLDGFTASGEIIEEISDGKHPEAYSDETLSGAWSLSSGTLVSNTATLISGAGYTGGASYFEIEKTFDVFYEKKMLFCFELDGVVNSDNPVSITLVTDDYDSTTGALVGGDHIRTVFEGSFLNENEYFFEIDFGEYMGGQLDFNSTKNAWPVDPDKMQLTFTIKYEPENDTNKLAFRNMTFRTIEPAHPHASYDWADAAFSSNAGFPKRIKFFDGRMVLAATEKIPNGIWMSTSTDDTEDFNAYDQEEDTAGMFLPLDTEQLEEVSWLMSKKDLWVGTDIRTWRITSSESGATISPSTIKAVPEATFGSEDLQALSIDNVIMHVSRSGHKIREIAYNLEEDSYKSIEASLFGAHIFEESPVKDWAWQQQPFGLLWIIREDGALCGMTYLREQDVLAWWRCPRENTEFESVCSTSDIDGIGKIWVTTKRTINGATKRFVEYIEREYTDIEDWFYLDCALVYEGSPTTTVSGLDHLEGEEVGIFGDGCVLMSKTVSSGAVDLEGDDGPQACSKVVVGLVYESSIKTQNIEQQLPTGTIQGQVLEMHKIVAKLHRSGYGLQFASQEDGPWSHIDVRMPDSAMDEPPPPYTGDAVVFLQTENNPGSSLFIKHDQPTACNVLGLIAEWQEGD